MNAGDNYNRPKVESCLSEVCVWHEQVRVDVSPLFELGMPLRGRTKTQ